MGVQGRGSHKRGLELITITIFLLCSCSAQTQFQLPSKVREGSFSAEKSEEKMKIKLLVWFGERTMKNQKDGNGKKQTMKASSDMNTPAAGLSSISTLLSLQQSE